MKKLFLLLFACWTITAYGQSNGNVRLSIYGNGIFNTGTWTGTGVPYVSSSTTPAVRAVSGTGSIVASSGTATAITITGSNTVSGTMAGGTYTAPTISAGMFTGSNNFADGAKIYFSSTTGGGLFWTLQPEAAITFDATTQQKLHLNAPRIDALFGSAQGNGFFQMGQHGFDNSYIFAVTEGDATAARVNVPSKRFAFEHEFWNGSSDEARYSVMLANTDSAGNDFISFAPSGTVPQPAFPFSWPPATGGTPSVRMFQQYTETPTLRITGTLGQAGTSVPTIHHATGTTTGINVTGSNITLQASGTTVLTITSGSVTATGLAKSGANTDITTLAGLTRANAAPSYAFETATTTGLGCFGSDWQLVRAGAVSIQSDNSFGILVPTAIYFQGNIRANSTIVGTGTTGAVTINKPTGRVNIAASGTSLVVTNNLITSTSHPFGNVATNDTTCKSVAIIVGTGSMTIIPNTAPTAETAVDFWIINN